jgi:hypothetical protein
VQCRCSESCPGSEPRYRVPTAKVRGRSRGAIEQRPSGAFRVRAYVGIDPISRKRHYRTEHVPAGPSAHKEAEEVLTRLLSEIDDNET